ncbi:monocarboxylate transporter 9-like [Saccostrea cucullata]|uniref:monocarboxylate transporter 9-like n=1 Tax=Saccostrea cuccullata TaxID=36930 RepID=UPI002ED0825F
MPEVKLKPPKTPPQPIDEGWAWLILAAAMIATFLWGGVVRGFGVLFVELQTEFRMSAFLISLVVALHIGLFTVGGLVALTYGARFLTTRQCLFMGTVLAVFSFVFSSLAKDGRFLFVSYGLILGLAFSIVIGPSTLLVSQYFQEKRNTAAWCIQLSSCAGALLFAPLQRSLIDKYFLRGSLLITAGILGHLLIASALMRPPELYRKWEKLKRKIEKKAMKASLLGRDGVTMEPFRPRSPTSDSTFSPLARQAMFKRMISRSDLDDENPATSQTEKSPKQSRKKETEQINKDGKGSSDSLMKNQQTSRLPDKSVYSSYEFGISTPFLEQRYKSRKRTESDKSIKSDISECSIYSESSTTRNFCGRANFDKCFNSSIINSMSFVIFTIGFALGIPTVITVLFLPDIGTSNNLNDLQCASLISIYMIGEILGRAGGMFLSYRHIDDFFIIATSLLVAGILQNLLQYFVDFFLLVIFSLVIGVCGGPINSLYANVIQRSVHPNEISSGGCVLHIAQGLSWTLVIPITGILRDSSGSYSMPFHFLGSLAIASSFVVMISRICLKKHRREVFQPDLETGELESHEIIIK